MIIGDFPGLPTLPISARGRVAALEIRLAPKETLSELHTRYVAERARQFGVDANAFAIRLDFDWDAVKGALVPHHLHRAGGRRDPRPVTIHRGWSEWSGWRQGLRAAVDPDLKAAYDRDLFTMRRLTASGRALDLTGWPDATKAPAWAHVGDDVVANVLEGHQAETNALIKAVSGKFNNGKHPSVRKNAKTNRLETWQPVDIAGIPRMRGDLVDDVLVVDTMEMEKGVRYTGHTGGARLGLPAEGSMPDILVMGTIGRTLGQIIDHPHLPGNLPVTNAQKTARLLQVMVTTKLRPLAPLPQGMRFDPEIR